MTFKRIIVIAVGTLFAVFILQNAHPVEVRFLFWQTTASRAIVLFVTFCVGLVTGWLTSIKRKKPQALEEDHAKKTTAAKT